MELTDYVLTEEANRSLPCPSARRAVNKRFVHRERGPVKVAGCHFPGDNDDSLAVFHDRQEEKIRLLFESLSGINRACARYFVPFQKGKINIFAHYMCLIYVQENGRESLKL